MKKTEKIACWKCSGTGHIKDEYVDESVSSTAFRSDTILCEQCCGHGKLVIETTTRILRINGEELE